MSNGPAAQPSLPHDELRQQLAAIEHERWADWQKWVHKIMRFDLDDNDEEVALIPVEVVNRWERQINTPYDQLSDAEKASDMEQVDRYWPLIEALILAQRQEAAIAELIKMRDEWGYANKVDSWEDYIEKRLAALQTYLEAI